MIHAAADTPKPNAREAGKSQNRTQLIDAAASAIFRHGIRGTTAATIQEQSGLSRGMVNLHFGSKENLLLAVAETLAGTYARNWQEAIAKPGSPANRLRNLIEADFSPRLLNARDVAIWFSFRAESTSNSGLRRFIDSRDQGLRDAIFGICTDLKAAGGYDTADPKRATTALIALFEGMWTDFHMNSAAFDREEAIETCIYVARAFFPDHF